MLRSRGQRSPSLACFGLPCSILTPRSMARKDVVLLGICQVPESISCLWQSMRRGRGHGPLEHLGCAACYHSGLLPPLCGLSVRKGVSGWPHPWLGADSLSCCYTNKRKLLQSQQLAESHSPKSHTGLRGGVWPVVDLSPALRHRSLTLSKPELPTAMLVP